MQDSTTNYINQEDFGRILDTIPQLGIRKWLDDDVKILFKIMYYSALRPMEAIRLDKDDIDIKNGTIYLGKTKTKTIDTAQIFHGFSEELEEWLWDKDDGRLFVDLTYHRVYEWIVRLGKMLQIQAWLIPEYKSGEKTKAHIFRKSIGKDMVNGMYGEEAQNISVIASLMRHSKPSMTMDHYLKVNKDTLKKIWSKSND
jgi:integrase